MSPSHEHCLRRYEGVIHMVIPDGHVLLKCCKCDHAEMRHHDHWRGHPWVELPRSRIY